MDKDQEKEMMVKAALDNLEQYWWEPDFKACITPAVTKLAAAGGLGNLSDPVVIARLRDPGPYPQKVEGLTFSERTIPVPSGDCDYQLSIRVYVPHKPSPLRLAYVMYHRGGLTVGDKNHEHQRCVELTKGCGAVGISVNFRMAPENSPTVILGDCYAALKWLTETSSELNVDPRRIVVMGASGGGSMALSIAQMARDRGDTHPMLQIAFCPIIDDRMPLHHASRYQEFPIMTGASIRQVTENLKAHGPYPPYIIPNRTEDVSGVCPAMMIVAGNDPLRDEAIEYSTRLMDANVPTALHVIPGVAHSFDLLAPECAASKQASRLISDAFRRAAAEKAC